ncbi:MAG: hypothetical protein JWP25_1099 [Bradyrhizobium sp.]|nr:hypothetical protein [Bradyrhizobium sp.]
MAARDVLYLCLPRRPSASAIIKLRALANCRLWVKRGGRSPREISPVYT